MHPAVADAVVVGAPHERFGQQIVAFIEPQPATEPDLAEVRDHVRSRLAAYKVPRVMAVVPSIARAVNGKVDQARWRAEAVRLTEDGSTRLRP